MKRSGEAHSATRHVRRRTMQVSQSSNGPSHEAKRHKGHHEAELIPGVDGNRIWGFPNSIITKLRYCDYMVLTGGSGARAVNYFSANGIFDCDITNTGHQPMFRDQYAAIYNNYVVLGSKIKVQFAPGQALASVVGIVLDDSGSVSTAPSALMELNNSVSAIAGPVYSGCNPISLTMDFEPLEFFGVDAKDDGASQTAVGANPVQDAQYAVWVAHVDGVTTTNVAIKVEIEYTVKFQELVTITQS